MLGNIVNGISTCFHGYREYLKSLLKPFLFSKKIAKHEMANICTITIPPVPITHLTSKYIALYPLVNFFMKEGLRDVS